MVTVLDRGPKRTISEYDAPLRLRHRAYRSIARISVPPGAVSTLLYTSALHGLTYRRGTDDNFLGSA